MKKTIAILLALVLTISLAACGTTTPPAGEPAPAGSGEATPAVTAEDEVLRIGCVQDITGPTSTLGKMVEAGARWAIDDINANGGIDGKQILLTTYDTKGDVNEAINAFTRAVTVDKSSVIIAPPVANIALALAPVSEQYDVPVLTLAIDPKAHAKEDGTPYRNMFGLQPSALQMGDIMASYAMKNELKTFGVIYNEGNAYSLSLLDPFIASVEKNGGEVKGKVSFTSNDKDYKTLLSKLIAEDVDAIYSPNYTQELILIVQQLNALGYDGKIICGLDANPPFNTLLGEDADNVYFINNVDDTKAELQQMIADVKGKTGIDATNKFFLGYDIGNILASAFKEVGSDPVAIRDYVENLSGHEGLTGSIFIDKDTHMPKGLEMVMYTYEGTTPVMLERYAAA